MPDAERNIVVRLESVISGSVGRAFTALGQNVGRLESQFADSKQEVARLTREIKRMAAAGEDVSAVSRELEEAKQRTAQFRREVARAKERMDQLNRTQQGLSGLAGAFGKVGIASGAFSAAMGYGTNEVLKYVLEMEEAINRAGLTFEQGSRLIFAAQRAGIRDAEGFVEEMKEIPRAIAEANEEARKADAFARLGLDLQALGAMDPTEQLLTISAAARRVGRDQRQFLLEESGLTGTLADQILHAANLTEEAYARFAEGAHSGTAVSKEQAEGLREAQGAMAELRQTMLLGAADIITAYLPEIKALIATISNGAQEVLGFVRDNKGMLTALAAVSSAALLTAAGFKAMALALATYKAVQAAVSATSLLSFTNPATAAIVGFGLALAGVVWLLQKFRKSADEAGQAQLPDVDAFGGNLAARDAEVTRLQRRAEEQVGAGRRETPRTPVDLQTTPLQAGARAGAVSQINITINASFASLDGAGEQLANDISTELTRLNLSK